MTVPDHGLTWRDRASGNALYTLSQLTQSTARYTVEGREHLAPLLREGRSIIFAAWHGMTMMLVGGFPLIGLDLRRFVLILPDDWRGAALTQFTDRLGARPYPMNVKGDGSMGAARKLVGLTRLSSGGMHAYVTPDGPEGPAFEAKLGLVFMAQKTGAPIVPLGAFTRYGVRLSRWDQYLLPYPRSPIQLVIGRPFSVGRREKLPDANERLTNALHRVAARAVAGYFGGLPS